VIIHDIINSYPLDPHVCSPICPHIHHIYPIRQPVGAVREPPLPDYLLQLQGNQVYPPAGANSRARPDCKAGAPASAPWKNVWDWKLRKGAGLTPLAPSRRCHDRFRSYFTSSNSASTTSSSGFLAFSSWPWAAPAPAPAPAAPGPAAPVLAYICSASL
jgi:hypothetical protein